MNLGRASVVVRQRSLLEVVDLAFRFVFGLAPGLYARLSAAVLLPCLAICALLRHFYAWDWFEIWVLAAAFGTVAQGVFTLTAGQLMFSEEVSARVLLRTFARRLPRYLSALLVTRTAIALGSLLVLLAPVAWVAAAFVHEAVLLEASGSGIEAFRRSSRFVRHHGRATFELIVVLVALTAVCIGVFELIGNSIVQFVLQLGTPFGALDDGGSLYALIGYFASIPVCATVRFLAYIDARTRRDGWDVQVQFMAIVAEAEERVA